MSTRRVLLVFFLAALVIVTLAGCAQGVTPSPSRGTVSIPTSTPLPPATPTSPSQTVVSGETRYYDCAALLSNAEVQQATGLPDAALFAEEKEIIPGQTYCQFFAEQGAISIAVSVLTGPSFQQVYQPLLPGFTTQPSIPGLGDEAYWNEMVQALVIRVGDTGITVFFSSLGGDLSDIGDLQGAAITIGRLVVSRL